MSKKDDDPFADVDAWLTKLGMPEYSQNFRSHNVSGAEIYLLEDHHLKEMGIKKMGHRIKLLNSAKTFKKAIKATRRNETVMKFQQFFLCPCTCWEPTYTITEVALVVETPDPLNCTKSIDNVDFSSFKDVGLKEMYCLFGWVEVYTKDPTFPYVRWRLGKDKARLIFKTVRNLIEEDQELVGARTA